MSSSSSSAAFPTASGGPLGDNGANGIGAGVYYAAIGVAVAIIASITLLSRILYARKLRAMQRRRAAAEREAMDRRGEAAGLPTYSQSRTEGRQLDANTWTAPPDDDVPEEEAPSGLNHYIWSRLPTFNLPAALHLGRHERAHDLQLPAYSASTPGLPKYDDVEADGPRYPPAVATAETGAHPPEMQQRSAGEEGAHTEDLPPPIDAPAPGVVAGTAESATPPTEEFDGLHPEERRRLQAERDATNNV